MVTDILELLPRREKTFQETHLNTEKALKMIESESGVGIVLFYSIRTKMGGRNFV